MDKATYQVAPGFVWPTVGHPGRVPLWALAPSPNQPRTYFDPDELKALAETMCPDKKGHQREIVTVRALTSQELEQYFPARYLIKSGERRWRAADIAGLADIEIRVKEYENAAFEKLDMYMLNENRVGLSDIEDAHYLAGLMSDFALTTQEELSALTGKKLFHVSQHLALLKLIPEVQALMHPSIDVRSRLRMGSAIIFSRLKEDAQREFVDRMPKGKGVTTRRQVDWLKAEIAKGGVQISTRQMKPGKLRQAVVFFMGQLSRRAGEIARLPEFDRLFDNLEPDEAFNLLGDVKDAQAELSELVARIEELSKPFDPPKAASTVERQNAASKPATPQPAAKTPSAAAEAFAHKHNKSGTKATTPAVSPEPIVKRVHEHGKQLLGMQAGNRAAGTNQHDPVPSPPKRSLPTSGKMGGEKTITYMGENGRKVTDKVNQAKYLELWDKGLLGFQVDNKDRPAWMPTREGAVEDWKKFCD